MFYDVIHIKNKILVLLKIKNFIKVLAKNNYKQKIKLVLIY